MITTNPISVTQGQTKGCVLFNALLKQLILCFLFFSPLFSFAQNITTVAGGGVGDGLQATNANINTPVGVAVDGSGNIYIVDYINHRIRKVSTNGTISTVAGNGTAGFSGDGGPATSASLRYPMGVAVDESGNIYIADHNNYRIRMVNTHGIISTVAGNGTAGFSGDGGPATSASINRPAGVAVDGSGNIYIADPYNNRIRKVSTNGIISTFAGNDDYGFSGDGGPASNAILSSPTGVAVDGSGNIYITDQSNHRIRKVNANGTISTVAGNGTAGFSGDGGPATSASINTPAGVSVDGSGNIYIADRYNHRIRKVSTNGTISTVAGTGSQGFNGDNGHANGASLSNPGDVAIDGNGNMYIADQSNHRIRKVSTNGTISTVAGNGTTSYSGDGGPATSASFWGPIGIAVDGSGNIYIADQGNSRIRKVSTSGTILTVAGNGTPGYGGDGGPATSASLSYPSGVAVDESGNIYVVDNNNHRIRKVSTNGTISTVAGNGTGGFSGDGGPATSASLRGPNGVVVDGNGNIYISDSGNSRIRKVSMNGTISTVAGNGTPGYGGDGGPATSASINGPIGIAVDGSGNIYIADQSNSRIRKVSTNGTISTVAGNGTYGFSGDGGPANSASLTHTTGVAIDGSGNIYIADQSNFRIRKVSTNGTISTVVGNGNVGFSGDGGPATSASLRDPKGVTVDGSGNIYIADVGNNRIRKVTLLSSNADLTSITLSAGTLSPAFASATTSYTASVANGVTSVAITPTASHSKATITVNGTSTESGTARTVNLNVGINTTPVVVTAEDGSTKTYTLAITRAALPAPTIATQPTNASVCPGSSASFTVAANNAVSYQWQVFTTSWQNITNNTIYSGATTTTLTITNTTGLHNKQYRCVVTGNSSPEAITQVVTLSAADVTKPTAIARNISVTLDANGTATITPEQVNNNSTDNCGIQTITLSKSSFSCENVGANTITLTVTDKSGNNNTVTATVTVQKAPQTITFNALATATYGAAPITLNATTTSGAAIVYTLTGPATVNENVLTITGAGEVKVTATQPGTACYEAAIQVTQTLQVEKATATITLSNLEQPENGEPRAVIATTTPQGLNVTLTYDGKPEAPSLQGSYVVVATIDDANYTGSATATLTVQAPTGLGDDLKELKGVSLYPNPTGDGKVSLVLENVIIRSALLVEIYTASGKLVRSLQLKSTTQQELDLSGQAAGLYLVRVSNGKEVKTIKVQKL